MINIDNNLCYVWFSEIGMYFLVFGFLLRFFFLFISLFFFDIRVVGYF